MKKQLSVLLLSAGLVSGLKVFAASPSVTGPFGDAVLTDGTQTNPPAPTTLSRRGTIDKYDTSTRTLSLSTANGTMQFTLASTVRIRQGWHKLNPSELEKFAGRGAAVRYSESGGNQIVESVHVFGKNERR